MAVSRCLLEALGFRSRLGGHQLTVDVQSLSIVVGNFLVAFDNGNVLNQKLLIVRFVVVAVATPVNRLLP